VGTITEELIKAAVEHSFSQALEKISEQSEEKQSHFMTVVALIARSYIHQDHSCVIVTDDSEALHIISSNATEMEAIECLRNACAMMEDVAQEGRPEHLN